MTDSMRPLNIREPNRGGTLPPALQKKGGLMDAVGEVNCSNVRKCFSFKKFLSKNTKLKAENNVILREI